MLQTLFHIPHELAGIPVFGFGWGLAAWVVVCLVWLIQGLRRPDGWKELQGSLPLMLIVAALIVFVAPRMEEVAADGTPLGVPIRGYGVMMLVAIVTGVGLAAWRARRVGIDPEYIFSLALWMCIPGVIGARAFYVAQKWDQFRSDDLATTLTKIVSFTEGGLVVFGSLIGALLGLIAFCQVRKLPVLAMTDLVAPSMAIGQAIGRIGCFLNGCCYGAYCEVPQLAVQFPPEAPVYADQLMHGALFGVQLDERPAEGGDKNQIVVRWVVPGSEAEAAGVEAGEVVTHIEGVAVDSIDDVQLLFHQLALHVQEGEQRGESLRIELRLADGERKSWIVRKLPSASLPVHPTQLYSAIDAGLLFLVLWFFYPFRQRDGEVTALLLTLHPISRFLLEVARVDEGSFAGTPFTISQLVSFGLLAAGIALWAWAVSRPRGTAFAR